MKKNKLIAFVTALSMTASMGISMISASANDDVNSEIVATQAVTKGFELEYNADASTETTRVIDVYYRGVPDILSAKVKFVYPAGTVTGATYVSTIATQPTVVLDNMAAGVINVVYGGMQGETSPNNQLGTLTITVPETTGEFVLELGECEIFNGNFQEETGLDPCSITIPAYSSGEVTEEPSEEATEEATEAPTEEVETPYPITRPTPIPVPTEEPTATPVATAEPVTKGFELEYDVDASTETTRVINVYYRGVPDILSAKVKFEYPAGTVTGATYVSTIATQPTVVLDNMAAGIINVVYGGMQGETSPNNQLGTLTITVPENTGEFVLQLGDCEIFNGNFQEETDLDSHWITIPAYSTTTEEPSEEPTETETPTFDNDGELNLSDIVTDAPAEYEGGKLIAVVIDVTIDGETAEYSTDFVVEYDNKVLTADEYYNLINGYTEPDMAKVISGLKFLVNDGVNVYAAPAYQTTEQEATGEMTVVPSYGGEATYETATEEPEDGTSRLTVSDPSNGDIRIDYTDADGSHVSKTTADGKITVDVPDGTEVEFTAIPKSGYTFSKWGGDLSGTANPDTLTITRDRSVTATFERAGSSDGGSSSSSGGSSSTGNATGGIARPNGGTTSSVGTTINFQDLGSVPWAETAINFLAQAGIINGRSNTEFDPNASVTRAEFAKMVCATFGIQPNTTAAQTFTDVAPSDWFYGYVQAASAAGIVNGVSDTAFDPNATIKRQEMAAMLYRAIDATGRLATLPAGTAKTFSDYDQIDSYAQGYVTTLSSAGIINGTSDTTFEPYATATRAQAAAILYQYLDAVGLAS